MSEVKPSLLEFPCNFPIKAFGNAGDEFPQAVLEIVQRHAPDVQREAVTARPSKGGKYLAVTINLRAESQDQLDAIYRDLSQSPIVLMAL